MRGQTTLDFAIGVSIFLAVVLFTFGFIPTVLDPFDVVAEENPALADRTADNLANGQLGSAEQPNIFDRYCTVEFFKQSDPPAECNYDGTTLEERLNLDIGQNVNVTIVGGEQPGDELKVQCWTDSAGGTGAPGLVNAGDADCDPDSSSDTVLAIGDERPDDQDTTITARRVASLYGETVVLEVVLW